MQNKNEYPYVQIPALSLWDYVEHIFLWDYVEYVFDECCWPKDPDHDILNCCRELAAALEEMRSGGLFSAQDVNAVIPEMSFYQRIPEEDRPKFLVPLGAIFFRGAF